MHVAFGGNIDLQGGRYGNAVLSRYPIVDHENHLLPRFDDGEQRGVLVARIRIPGLKEPLRFLATHLDHRSKDRERIASVRAIAELFPDDPTGLLAGDLNDDAASATLQLLETNWSRTNRDPLPTVPVDHPTRQIDFILFRPSDRWRVLKTRTLAEAAASDHRAILAELSLQPN
jgi:endonuclease/exonuclease/phosphatase family metal-dependent hydrolase